MTLIPGRSAHVPEKFRIFADMEYDASRVPRILFVCLGNK